MLILVVEDEEKLARALSRGLQREGYAVDYVLDGSKARNRLRSRGDDYDLIILDWMLPGVDGLTLCREARARGQSVPILMLTARDETGDKVAGLDGGADDYLVKPFAFDELLARVRTLLRRPARVLPPVLRHGDLTLDPAGRTVELAGRSLDLTTREFALLEYFLRHRGEVLSRERILDHVWDSEYDAFSNVVDVHVKNLRKKLADVAPEGAEADLFVTVRGVGYGLKS
jgi:DNA-binding response OmpR family regulator